MKYLIKFLRVLGASIGIFFIIFLMIVTIELFEVSKIIVLPVTAIGLFFVRDFFENHAWWKIRAWEQKNLAHGIKLKRFFKQRGDLPSDGVCKVGPFYGKVFSQPSFHAGAAALFSRAPLLTVQKRLSVDIPPVGNFRFNISGEQISHADWMRWQASSNDLGSDLIASLTWDVPEPQLRQALQAPEAIWCLFHLFLLGKCEIACEDGVISVHIAQTSPPWSRKRQGSFFSISKELIRIYAQIACRNVPEWYFLQNDGDCWDDESDTMSGAARLPREEKMMTKDKFK